MNNFGYELLLDLSGCDLDTISDGEKIKTYATELCKVIKMKPYGEPRIEYFGLSNPKTKGYTLVQLIETSSITAHFSEGYGEAFINIFSCKDFDEGEAMEFSKKYFKADGCMHRFVRRG